jgi:Tfp pilus assembly protein PilO
MSSSSASRRAMVGMLVVAVLAAAFWVLALSPKREQANSLATEVEQQQATLSEAQAKVAEATAARGEFSSDYRQLVALGKAVPASDETASLLVGVSRIADRAGVRFQGLHLTSEGSTESEAGSEVASEVSAASAVPAAATLPPTEAEAALLPLGATIGSAGLGVMPYTLDFTGSFFQVAGFIQGVDSLIHTGESAVGIDGRLITVDGFSLVPDTTLGFPKLNATFSVTTYIVPPDQGITAGATATSPATTPASTEAAPATGTGTGTPSSYTTESAR